MVITTLYRQIVIQQDVPFSMTLNKIPPTLEEMTKAQLDAKLERGYQQAITRQGRPLNNVFFDLEMKHTVIF